MRHKQSSRPRTGHPLHEKPVCRMWKPRHKREKTNEERNLCRISLACYYGDAFSSHTDHPLSTQHTLYTNAKQHTMSTNISSSFLSRKYHRGRYDYRGCCCYYGDCGRQTECDESTQTSSVLSHEYNGHRRSTNSPRQHQQVVFSSRDHSFQARTHSRYPDSTIKAERGSRDGRSHQVYRRRAIVVEEHDSSFHGKEASSYRRSSPESRYLKQWRASLLSREYSRWARERAHSIAERYISLLNE
eukprot:scaffold1942_cov197-Alexandrium_tamarense.AAC.29